MNEIYSGDMAMQEKKFNQEIPISRDDLLIQFNDLKNLFNQIKSPEPIIQGVKSGVMIDYDVLSVHMRDIENSLKEENLDQDRLKNIKNLIETEKSRLHKFHA